MKESTTQTLRVLLGIVIFPESGLEELGECEEDVSNACWTFRLSVKS